MTGLLLAARALAEGGAPSGSGNGNGALPPTVEALFAEKDEGGKPVLGDADRALLKKLPAHTQELLAKALEDGTVGGAPHLKVLLGLELTPQSADIVFGDNCVLCHSDPEAKKTLRFSLDPKAAGTPEHLNLRNVLSDVHFRRGLSCSGCHGGKPTDTEMPDLGDRWPDKHVRRKDRTWIPAFCARCHADPLFMQGFNPALPTDQLAKYKDSRHGVLLLQQKDSKAAQCVSCHGAHGIRGPKSRASLVHPQNVPETCGRCHANAEYMAGYEDPEGAPLPTNQLEQFKKSVHGKALLEKGDLGAPACNDCHGNHAALPLAASSVAQVCRNCHSMNGTLFDGSKHKKEFEKHKWPECQKCHGKHDIAKPTDDMIDDSKKGLCGGCHAENAKDNPDCNKGARYFHATLSDLRAKAKSFPPEIEHLAERGLDTEKVLEATAELDEAIVQAQVRMHTFDKSGFDVGAKVGREAVAKTEKLMDDARAEQRLRLRWLLAVISFMGFFAVAMALKIRDLAKQREKERNQSGPGEQPTAGVS